MIADLTGLCHDHSFERAESVCRRCGLEFCELCLLYPSGTNKPLCKECAMVMGGVRSHGSRPEMPKRDMKRRVKDWDARQKATAPSNGEDPSDSNPVLNDPLAPTEEDLERVPATVPDNGAEIAAAVAETFSEPPPPPPPPPPAPAQEPADGVAPPIDWSQPFG